MWLRRGQLRTHLQLRLDTIVRGGELRAQRALNLLRLVSLATLVVELHVRVLDSVHRLVLVLLNATAAARSADRPRYEVLVRRSTPEQA